MTVLAAQNGQNVAPARSTAAPAEAFGVSVLRDVMVPMRDGVKLAADIYVPVRPDRQGTGAWPVVLTRTPYNKANASGNSPDGAALARRGYVNVLQDVRGRYGSEGVFNSYEQEGPDGWDTMAWIMRQPWSNGKIVVTGSSYFAATAQAILVQNPPGLAAAIIRAGPGNYHEEGAWRGGAFLLAHNVNYALDLASTGKETAASPAVRAALQSTFKAANAFALMRLSPLAPGASPFALAPSYDRWYLDWQTHETYDEFWQKIGNNALLHYSRAPDIPILLISNWYDPFLGGMLDGFTGYAAGKRSPVHLIVGGGEHYNVYSMRTFAGDVELGAASPIAVGDEMTRWLDQYVGGKDRGPASPSLIRAFRIGGGDGRKDGAGRLRAGGEWQEFREWPPADARSLRYFLNADHALSPAAPTGAGSLTFVHDPAHPVPSIGGAVSSGGDVLPPGPFDQRCVKTLMQCADELPLSARSDVLTFTTPPLASDVEVTGPLAVQLHVSSSAPDTDFVATLIDQYPPTPDYPNGYAMNIATGIVRARFRSFTQESPSFRRNYGIREEPLTPGRQYDVTVDLWGTSVLFKAGHRIRLNVSSSSFPQFDVNPNTGEPFAARRLPPVEARNTVYVGGTAPSYLEMHVRSME